MATLTVIRAKVRRITARPSTNQLSDTDLDFYINEFLTTQFPSHARDFYNLMPYSFPLTPNDAFYPITAFKNEYLTFEEPAYIDGYKLNYFQDVAAFFNYFPQQKYSTRFATGTGAAGPYVGTYTYRPIESGTVVISAQDAGGTNVLATDVLTNAAASTFVDQTGAAIVGSTINYNTGAITGITFTSPVPLGNTIQIAANYITRGRPMAVLYYNNGFRFWPFPDQAYSFTIMAYKNPLGLAGPGSTLDLNVWAEVIAYGASMLILSENMDMENWQKAQMLFDHHLCLAERRTLKQLSTQRVATIFSHLDNWPGSYYPYN